MPRNSTSVILFRRAPGLEVYLVLRSPELDFFGGYHAFPGGRAEEADVTVPLRGDAERRQTERESIGCGLRELFEETGVLAAANVSPPVGLGGDDLHAYLKSQGVEIDIDDWIYATRFVTPRFSSIRYDTRFYFVDASRTSGEPDVTDCPELSSGGWWRPDAALEAWARGDIHIAPPALVFLKALSDNTTLSDALIELKSGPAEFEGSGLAIPWGPGVDLLPLPTHPLPASIPTTTHLVGGNRLFIVDPAPAGEGEQQHLLRVIETRRERGDRLEAIVLTHHHADHVGALDLLVERYECPVWAHPRTGELIERRLDRELLDGDLVDLGTSPDGRKGWDLECLFTPGHAEGHLALFDKRYGALLAGDLLSTIVSMYVGTPGGHLATYLESLRRIRELPIRTLYPAHGPPTTNPRKLVDRTLQHRAKRVEQVHAVLLENPGNAPSIAEAVYGSEVAEKLRPLFERTTRAALDYLVETRRAERTGDDSYRGLGVAGTDDH